MGYCPTELKARRWAGRGSRMGAGLGVLGAGLGVQGAQQERWHGAGRQACAAGRAGARRACVCARTGAQGVWRAAGA